MTWSWVAIIILILWNLHLQSKVNKSVTAITLLGEGYERITKWITAASENIRQQDDINGQQVTINQGLQDQIVQLTDIVRQATSNEPTAH